MLITTYYYSCYKTEIARLRFQIQTAMSIDIQRVSIGDIRNNPSRYNSSNHPRDQDKTNTDYLNEVSKTDYSKYMDQLVPDRIVWRYKFTPAELQILLEACEFRYNFNRRPSHLADDLMDIKNRLTGSWIQGYWFVRFDACSFKDSDVKGCISSSEQIIAAICSSRRVINALKSGNDTLFFIRWNHDLDFNREFRCFINNGKLTAISQYSWFTPGLFGKMTDEQLINCGKSIQTYLITLIDKAIPIINTKDFVADLYYETDHSMNFISLIELNPFGSWLSSGSALFHWIEDKKILYSDGEKITMRVLEEE